MKLEYNRHARARMFENDFLEFASNIHPAVPFVVYIPVIVGCWRGDSSRDSPHGARSRCAFRSDG